MYPKPMAEMINALKKLPGIGPKAAYRLSLHILEMQYDDARNLARSILQARKTVKPCTECCNFTDVDPCPVCADERRERGIVCVVEESEDVAAIERAGGHKGLYHVLGGKLNALRGVGPGDLHIRELVRRVKKKGITEVLIATDPDVEGEATALHIAGLLKPLGVRVTRPARGVPAGADLNYIDSDTLTRAINARQEM